MALLSNVANLEAAHHLPLALLLATRVKVGQEVRSATVLKQTLSVDTIRGQGEPLCS